MNTTIYKQDCSAPQPGKDQYIQCQETRVIESAAGSYREADGKPGSRFCYRFPLEAGRPHRLRVVYPDDKRRFMMIHDGTTYDLCCAVATGHAFPLSGKTRTLEHVFWPRFSDFSVCFMTMGEGEPAAVCRFEVEALSDQELSALDVPAGGRCFGLQYEDPCGICASEGALDFTTWMEHVATYMKHTGQNMLCYPICWYHGPLMPGTGEDAHAFNVACTDDRKYYTVWTENPPDWPRELMRRLGKDQIDFMAELTLLRLPSLMKQMNIDLKGILRGEPTINNMLWNNRVQTGTMDWTFVYHPKNYPQRIDCDLTPHGYIPGETLVFGERCQAQDGLPSGPIFNPLHPTVQKTILTWIGNLARQYADLPNFKGIVITMWVPTLVWFGSLRAGYDDYVAGLFEKETGISLPPECQTGPERFSHRYQFLTGQHRDRWISWRCEKIRDFICAIRDELVKARPDLQLGICCWNEPLIPRVRGTSGPENQYGTRDGMQTIYREGGMDISLLAGERNISITLQYDGGNRDRTPALYPGFEETMFHAYRDHDFLDRSLSKHVGNCTSPTAYVFNAWHEVWGDHRWLKQPGPKELTVFNQPGSSYKQNSYYPEDGFWWEGQMRIAPATAPGAYYMEMFAHALAENDVFTLTSGGLYMDKVHTEEFRKWNEVFRRLPKARFETVDSWNDPVTVRRLQRNDDILYYWVNREAYSAKVTLGWSEPVLAKRLDEKEGRMITDLAFSLSAFELAAYSFGRAPDSLTIQPDAEAVAFVREQAERLLAAKDDSPAAVRLKAEVRAALTVGQVSRLRHLLESYEGTLLLPRPSKSIWSCQKLK